MGTRFRKSKNFGPLRITASKSGLSASVGVKGLRVTKMANGRTRMTASIPGTGLSYVKESSKSSTKKPASINSQNEAPVFPRVHSNTSFYFSLAFALIFGFTGLTKLFATNVYEMEGWQTSFFLCAVLAFIAYRLRKRNKREKTEYDAAVSAHIAQQQELENRLEEERLRQEREQEKAELKHAEEAEKRRQWADTHGIITTNLAGVTFSNEDGSSRQRALQDALANDCCGTLDIEAYDHNGEQAVRVLYEGTQIGNIPKNRAVEVAEICDRISSASLRVVPFRPENDEGRGIGGVIYRAELTLVWLK